jgi:hypothetical protein
MLLETNQLAGETQDITYYSGSSLREGKKQTQPPQEAKRKLGRRFIFFTRNGKRSCAFRRSAQQTERCCREMNARLQPTTTHKPWRLIGVVRRKEKKRKLHSFSTLLSPGTLTVCLSVCLSLTHTHTHSAAPHEHCRTVHEWTTTTPRRNTHKTS